MLTCLCEAGNICSLRGTSRIFSLAFFPACLHARRRLVGTNWILGIAPDPINSKNGLRSTQKTFLTTCVLSSGKFFQKSKMNLIILKLLARISFRVLEQKMPKNDTLVALRDAITTILTTINMCLRYVQGGRSCTGARVAPAEKFGLRRKFYA